MNQKLLKIIISNKELFSPSIFTSNQINIIKKYISLIKLNNSEKKSLYTSINKKLKALNLIYDDPENFYVRGNPLRFDEAKKIISSFKGEKVFIAGSFLFSKNYNDIDIFILRKKGYKEVIKDKFHIVYLTEKKLSEAFFQSTAMISISNFNTVRKYKYKMPFLHEIMSLYHEAYIQIKNKDSKKEAVREIIFKYNLFVKKKLIDPLDLKKEISIIELDFMFKELCKHLFSKKYLYVEFMDYKKTLEKAIQTEKNINHLIHFKRNYEDLIYGKSKAKAY
jgi:hypothetical protein